MIAKLEKYGSKTLNIKKILAKDTCLDAKSLDSQFVFTQSSIKEMQKDLS